MKLIEMCCIDSALARAHDPDECLRCLKKSEMKAQRTLCLEALVGLAPHEEELGKSEYTVVNNLCTHVLSNPDGLPR